MKLRPRLRPSSAALLALALALAAACADREGGGDDATPESLADTPHVPPSQESFFTDVPVEGFEALTPDMQSAVAARANRAKCDCGCAGHSVNACLHARETCDVAVRRAAQFIADAALAESVAGLGPVPSRDEDDVRRTIATPSGATGAAPTGPAGAEAAATPGTGEPPIVVVTPPGDPLPALASAPEPGPEATAPIAPADPTKAPGGAPATGPGALDTIVLPATPPGVVTGPALVVPGSPQGGETGSPVVAPVPAPTGPAAPGGGVSPVTPTAATGTPAGAVAPPTAGGLRPATPPATAPATPPGRVTPLPAASAPR